MFDLAPSQYEALENLSDGHHAIGDLPVFARFRSYPHSREEWIVTGLKDIHGETRVACRCVLPADHARNAAVAPYLAVYVGERQPHPFTGR